MSCKAQIFILDNRLKRKNTIFYSFQKVKKYKDLFNDLKILLLSCKYKENECKFDRNQIKFIFKYFDKDISIIEWEKYILNRDTISIVINNPYFVLYEESTNIPIIKSKRQKDLYFYYNKYLKNKTVLLKCNNILIDVLDTNEHCMNQCIDRLIHTRNY